MRIALVIERFEPAGGGMEAVAWQVAHGLAEAGEEVHVVARRATASTAVTLHPVRVPSGWQPIRVNAFSRAARRAAPRSAFDVVHAFSRTRAQDLYRAGGGSHADYLERIHGRFARGVRRLSPRHALLLRIERQIFRDDAQAIQCGSRQVRDEIAARFRVPSDRLHVLYNGVDCARFHPSASASTRGGAPVWLFAGSGWRRKGLDTALRAMAASSGDSRLQVAGRDDTRAWRRAVAQLGLADRVDFLGERRDVAELYRQADALILPTRYDAFANVCLEAAASRLPVVTSGTNGSAEVLDGASIVVDEPEDVEGFTNALEMLQDPALRDRLGARGRAIAEGLTWAKHVDSLRELYRHVADRKLR